MNHSNQTGGLPLMQRIKSLLHESKNPLSHQQVCPHCGLLLPAYSSYCCHCHRFIDWNGGCILPPEKVDDAMLSTLVRETRQRADSPTAAGMQLREKRQKRLLLLGLALLFTIVLAPLGMLLVFIALIRMDSDEKAFKEYLSNEEVDDALTRALLPGILAGAFDTVLEYHHDRTLPTRLLQEAQLMAVPFNQVSGSDRIQAIYKKMPLALADVQLSRCYRTELGLQHTNEAFRGRVLVCGLGLELPALVTIRRRTVQDSDGLSTGDAAFDRLYWIDCPSPEAAALLLGPHLIDAVQALDQGCHGSWCLTLHPDGRAFLAIATPHDLFELPSLDEDIPAIRARFTQELAQMTALADCLDELAEHLAA